MRTLCSWILLTVMQMRVLSQFFVNGSTSNKTTPDTLANSHCGLGGYTRKQSLWSWNEPTTKTMLNDSNSLPTRHSHKSVMHQTRIGGFSAHFHTLVSVLWFPHFSVFHLPYLTQLISLQDKDKKLKLTIETALSGQIQGNCRIPSDNSASDQYLWHLYLFR